MLPGDQDRYEEEFRSQCQQMGLREVERGLATGRFGERKAAIARAWIAEQRETMAGAEAEADRALQREANDIARKALNRATWSTIIALAAAAIAGATLLHEVRKSTAEIVSAPRLPAPR